MWLCIEDLKLKLSSYKDSSLVQVAMREREMSKV